MNAIKASVRHGRVETDTPLDLPDGTTLVILPDSSTTENPNDNSTAIDQAIESSRDLLEACDEDGLPVAAKRAWERAVELLSSYAKQARDNFNLAIDAPEILPGPDQSIDLYWNRPKYEMLINVPVDRNEIPTYYGDDRRGNSIKGTIATTDNRGLLLWLSNQ